MQPNSQLIEDLKKRKVQLETDLSLLIQQKIDEFSKETGFTVARMDINQVEITSYASPYREFTYTASVNIDLPS